MPLDSLGLRYLCKIWNLTQPPVLIRLVGDLRQQQNLTKLSGLLPVQAHDLCELDSQIQLTQELIFSFNVPARTLPASI